MKILRVFTFSDLHYNARGSRYEEIKARLHEEIAKSDIIVLNGDIIEMFFPKHLREYGISRFFMSKKDLTEAYQRAADDGIEFVKDLLTQYPNKKFVYIEGNHENLDIFRDGVKALRDTNKNLIWGRRYFKIGSGLFFHGDNELDGLPVEKREKLKVHSVAHGQRREHRNFTFEAPVMWIMRFFRKDEDVIDKIFKFLAEKHPERLSGVTDIFFGHTHLPIGCYEKYGIKWHNTGSAAKYGKDNFQSFELEVPDDCKFKTDDKRVFYPKAKIGKTERVDMGGRFTKMVERGDSALATSQRTR